MTVAGAWERGQRRGANASLGLFVEWFGPSYELASLRSVDSRGGCLHMSISLSRTLRYLGKQLAAIAL